MKTTLLKMKLFASLSFLSIFTFSLTAQQNTPTDHAKNWSGAIYNANSSLQYDLDRAALEKITFSGTERVLDLGCGDGTITALIASKVPHGSVVGSDCAPKMIEFAQTIYASKIPNLSFATSYIEDISYENEFDIITSFCTLHWVADLPKAFAKISKALKPGGRALLFFPTSCQNPWRSQLADTAAQEPWAAAFEKNKPAELNLPVAMSYRAYGDYLENLCKQAGFNSTDIQVDTIPYTFPTIDTFKSWFKALAWFKSVPTEHQDEFLNTLVKRMLAYSPASDGTCTMHGTYATVLAAKNDPHI